MVSICRDAARMMCGMASTKDTQVTCSIKSCKVKQLITCLDGIMLGPGKQLAARCPHPSMMPSVSHECMQGRQGAGGYLAGREDAWPYTAVQGEVMPLHGEAAGTIFLSLS